jgi:glutathione synthase/RimK-type ligase-like ATP-grasp enzyme
VGTPIDRHVSAADLTGAAAQIVVPPDLEARMKRVALITWAGLPEGAESEQLLRPLLAVSGVDAQMVDWRDASVNFSKFDLLVLRSCWDYHLRAQEFADWLHRIKRVVTVLNDVDTVLWNSNKFYLRELQERGIQIAPTCFLNRGETLTKDYLAAMEDWEKVVVKPAISASAHETRIFEPGSQPLADHLPKLLGNADFLLQRFLPEIQTSGEISFIYIDGIYSHAVQKRPAAGDFRVQKEHGGSAELIHPAASLLHQAHMIADAAQEVSTSLYCRLDAVEAEGKLILMELELIEPELFLGLAEDAAERFAAAIVRQLSN